MRTAVFLLTSVSCTLLAPAQTTFVRSDRGPTIIEINAAKTAGYRIPRTVYGTFLEPIGRSIYGGLWAQLLENPSFEENLWSADQLRADNRSVAIFLAGLFIGLGVLLGNAVK